MIYPKNMFQTTTDFNKLLVPASPFAKNIKRYQQNMDTSQRDSEIGMEDLEPAGMRIPIAFKRR